MSISKKELKKELKEMAQEGQQIKAKEAWEVGKKKIQDTLTYLQDLEKKHEQAARDAVFAGATKDQVMDILELLFEVKENKADFSEIQSAIRQYELSQEITAAVLGAAEALNSLHVSGVMGDPKKVAQNIDKFYATLRITRRRQREIVGGLRNARGKSSKTHSPEVNKMYDAFIASLSSNPTPTPTPSGAPSSSPIDVDAMIRELEKNKKP